MNDPDKIAREKAITGPAIDIAIRIGVIALLIALCFNILRPFISPVIWGTILAIALFPACRSLSSVLYQVGVCHNYSSFAPLYHPPQYSDGRLTS